MTNEELLDKIKAEIERLKSIEYPCDNSQQETGFCNALDRMTDFLSTLESEKPVPSDLDFEQELYNRFGQIKDFTLGMRIGQYFYELGCRRTAEKYDEIEYNRQREEEKPRDLEERIGSYNIVPYIDDKIAELQDMWREEKVSFDWDDLKDMIEDVARHFYDLGQRNRPKISDNSFEEEIAGMYSALFGTDVINRKEMLYPDTFEAIARHFAEWGAENLKK